jgi:L-methionine (R)-S-oxide reductase
VHKTTQYRQVSQRLLALVEGESDEIALMATIACELYQGLDHVDWVGFYRVVQPGLLKVGPYQGTHGCLAIPFGRGVCGRCAREGATQLVPDVSQVPYHIACASTTRSEVVVPVRDARGIVRAVLDVDSDALGAFDDVDVAELGALCAKLGASYGAGATSGPS